MSDNVEMTLGVSLLLGEITEKLLYKVESIDGKDVLVDRDIPFRLRYRLNKNRVMFKKDSEFFNQRRLLYLAQYGEPTEDGQNVVIKDEKNMELFREAVSNLVDAPVSHNLMKLNPEDLELVQDTDIKVSPDAMSIFILYLTEDEALEKDLKVDINVSPYKPKSVLVDEKKEQVEAPVEEPAAEVPPVVEEAPKKKATRKKKVETTPTEEKPKKASTRKKKVKEDK